MATQVTQNYSPSKNWKKYWRHAPSPRNLCPNTSIKVNGISTHNLRPNETQGFKIRTDIPRSWRHKLPADFRPLLWVYPRGLGAKRLGYFESVLHDDNTRSKKVFLWQEGDKYLQVIPRPANLLPAEPLSWGNREGIMKGRRSREIIISQKKWVDDVGTATWIEHKQCKVLKFSYTSAKNTTTELDAGCSSSQKTLDQRNSCGSSDTSQYCVSSASDSVLLPYSQSPVPPVDNIKQWQYRNDLPDLADIQVAMVSHRKVTLEKEVIGQGTFGAVRPAHLNGVGQVVVKSFDELSTSEDILREARILAALAETSFVPKLFGVCYGRDFRVSIIQEFCAKGVTLFDVLTKRNLPDQIWIHIVKQLVLGVKLIHARGVLINDLKNDNILVDIESWNFELKFIDFGLASYGEGRIFHVCSELRPHLRHMAPEVLDGQPTSPASDIYSIGIILEEVSFQAEITGLLDLVIACLGPTEERSTCDDLLNNLDNLF